MTALALLRTTHSAVSVVNESDGGWPTWTRMKIVPATAAAIPAALVRPLLVICHDWLLVRSGPGGARPSTEPRNRRGDPTSPCDVTRGGDSPGHAVGPRAPDPGGYSRPSSVARRRTAARRVFTSELGEDVLGVAPQRVERHEQVPGDFRAGQLGREQAQHLALPLADAFGPPTVPSVRPRLCRPESCPGRLRRAGVSAARSRSARGFSRPRKRRESPRQRFGGAPPAVEPSSRKSRT